MGQNLFLFAFSFRGVAHLRQHGEERLSLFRWSSWTAVFAATLAPFERFSASIYTAAFFRTGTGLHQYVLALRRPFSRETDQQRNHLKTDSSSDDPFGASRPRRVYLSEATAPAA